MLVISNVGRFLFKNNQYILEYMVFQYISRETRIPNIKMCDFAVLGITYRRQTIIYMIVIN